MLDTTWFRPTEKNIRLYTAPLYPDNIRSCNVSFLTVYYVQKERLNKVHNIWIEDAFVRLDAEANEFTAETTTQNGEIIPEATRTSISLDTEI